MKQLVLFILLISVASAGAGTVDVRRDFAQPDLAVAGDWTRVRIAGCRLLAEPGEPVLPCATVCVLLPPGSAVADVIVTSERPPALIEVARPVEFARMPVQKSGGFSNNQPDNLVYRGDAPYPGRLGELVSVQRMAECDVALVRVFPLQYRPARNTLFMHSRLHVRVLVKENPLRTGPGPGRKDLLRVALFVDNPELLQEYQAATQKEEEFDYLLVAPAQLMPAFQPLIDCKTRSGLAVKTETMENIASSWSGRDNAERLRNYIRHAHTNWSVRYVLLGGDTPGIPCRYAYLSIADHYIPCDLYFACLDGSWNSDGDDRWGEPGDGEDGNDVDLLADVLIGRAPVDTPEEAAVFVEKTVRTEELNHPDPARALLAGSYLGYYPPGVHAQGGNMLDPLLPLLADYITDRLDDRPFITAQWDAENSQEALNRSPLMAVYAGHGDPDHWMALNAEALDGLTNAHAFLACSVSCQAGAFDNFILAPDCVGEELLTRHSAGAFAAVLNSREGWFDPSEEWRYSGEFLIAFLNQLTLQDETSLGLAHQAAKQELVGQVVSPYYRWCYCQITLFGDPHFPLRRAPPRFTSHGTPISWLAGYGWTDDYEAADLADADGDGAFAWEEWLAGTDPIDEQSVFRISILSNSPGSMVVGWSSVSNRVYDIYRNAEAIATGVGGTPPLNVITDSPPESVASWYWIRTAP